MTYVHLGNLFTILVVAIDEIKIYEDLRILLFSRKLNRELDFYNKYQTANNLAYLHYHEQ